MLLTSFPASLGLLLLLSMVEAKSPGHYNDEVTNESPQYLPRDKRLFVKPSSGKAWPKAILPYEIDEAALPQKAEYEKTIALYEDRSCVRMPQWNDSTKTIYGLEHNGRMNFIKSGGCYSTTKGVSYGRFSLSCCANKYCIHEIGHALGFSHEQSSPLRDGWVRANWNDIWPSDWSSYKKSTWSLLDLTKPYDISSIMHYLPWMYGIRSGSVSVLFPELKVTNDYFYFFMELAYGYNCAEFPQCGGKTLDCENDGYQTIQHGRCACTCPTGLDPDNFCKTPLKKVVSASWPKGSYALPKPKTGCPENGSFQDGKLMQVTGNDNKASTPSHMMGDMKGKQAELNFCTRTKSDDVFTSEDEAKFNWPIGHYCIYAKGDKCPTAFEGGSIKYDVTSGTATGQLPDGTYDQKTAELKICCQFRGFTVDPVDFPASKPFALIKFGSGCQAVTGMRVEDEWLTVSSSDKVTADPMTKAWVGKEGKSLTVPLCYYRPADMDCGGSIILSESNPVATIEMDGKGRTDVECTWIIKGDRNASTLVFDFDEFDVKKSGKDCVDTVEVRHSRIGQYGLRYCGEKPNHSIRSITNKLLVRFFTTGSSHSSFKATVRLTEFADMCYDLERTRGLSYDGSVNYTRTFQPCLPWAQVTECYHHPFMEQNVFDNLDGNACRNPDHSFRPWCYTQKSGCRRNYCDVCGIEVPHDRLDYCDKLKDKGFCTMDAKLAVTYCPKTCYNQLPGNEKPNKKYTDITCGHPTPPADGVIVGEVKVSYRLGETVQYKCNKGPSVVTSRCMTSGQWSEFGSACLECPIGSTVLDKTCYTLMQDGKTMSFDDANTMCKALSGTVAAPRTQKEASLILAASNYVSTWIGISDKANEGTWVYEADGAKLGWTNWEKSEPNNRGNEDCSVMKSNTKWTDNPCSSSYATICAVPALDVQCVDVLGGDKCGSLLTDRPTMCEELPDFAKQYCRRSCHVCKEDAAQCSVQNAHPNVLTLTTQSTISVGESVTYDCIRFTYPTKGDKNQACLPGGKLSGEPLQCEECPLGFKKVNEACHGLLMGGLLTFEEAHEGCQKLDGFMAMPKTRAENDVVSSLGFGQRVWIGATDGNNEGVFLWVDRSEVSWSNWDKDEPKASGGDQDCALMNQDKTWSNVKCGDLKLTTVCTLPKSGGTVCYDRKDKGATYNGNATVTIKNTPCINWAESCNSNPFKRGKELYNLESNYCRNPDGSVHGPWCYTSGCSWSYCDVCDRSSQPVYDVTDKGKTYSGTAHVAVKGEVCGNWADKVKCHVNPTQKQYAGLNFEKNYCRNYDGSPAPWCYTTDCNWAVCDMSKAHPLVTTNIVDMRCGPPTVPSDGQMVTVPRSSYRLGDRVTFKCKRNTFLVSTSCLTNGDWSPVGFACTECPVGYYPFGNTCYGYEDKVLNYDKSVKECAKMGGRLPRPKTIEESDFIKSINHGKNVWIDAKRYPDDNYKTFRWSDGTEVDWLKGKKDRFICTYIGYTGDWSSTNCDFLNPKLNLICAVPKLDVSGCDDFLEDQCGQLLTDKATMCGDHQEFARLFCAKTCGMCGNVKCTVTSHDRFSQASTTDTHIGAGETVEYSCKAGSFFNGGDKQRACKGDGHLTGTPIKCEACPIGYKEHSGFCYGFVDTPFTFSNAEKECGKVNGYIASPKNIPENDFVDSVRQGSEIWLGASDSRVEGDFRWQDGTKVEWTNWSPGEPRNFGGYEDCVVMGADKKWGDRICDGSQAPNKKRVVCSIPILGDETCYNPEDKGASYGGEVNVTKSSRPCIPWASAANCPHNPFAEGDERKNLVENYCRNPDNSLGPWCYTDADTCDKKYCNVCQQEKTKDYTSVKCRPPTPPSDGVLKDDEKFEYSVGDVMGIHCKTSNWSVPVTTTCLTSGQWTPVGFACTECPWGYELFKDQCYHFEDTALTFADARKYCKNAVGGYIASPKTSEQNDFISSVSKRHYMWIGLNDLKTEGAWLWEDGTEMTWSNWEAGEPNDWGTEDAAVIKYNKKWNDVYQGGKNRFVCATKKQEFQSVMCEDFLAGQCSMLLAQDVNMCTHHVQFASQFCARSCHLCSWDEKVCDVSPETSDVIVDTADATIKAGDSVKYSCSNLGLYHVRGDRTRTCLNSGELSGTPFECQAVDNAPRVTVGPATLTNGDKETPPLNVFFGNGDKYRIEKKGQILAWEFYSASAVKTALQVWRTTSTKNVYRLIGQTVMTTPSNKGDNRHDLPVGDRIPVQAGDFIGIVNAGKGGVRFSVCDKELHPDWAAEFHWSKKASSLEDYQVGSDTHFTSNPACVVFPLRAVVAVTG